MNGQSGRAIHGMEAALRNVTNANSSLLSSKLPLVKYADNSLTNWVFPLHVLIGELAQLFHSILAPMRQFTYLETSCSALLCVSTNSEPHQSLSFYGPSTTRCALLQQGTPVLFGLGWLKATGAIFDSKSNPGCFTHLGL